MKKKTKSIRKGKKKRLGIKSIQKSKGLMNRKRKIPAKSPSKWKLPTTVFLISLITIIIVIPTLIVAPFLKDDHQLVAHEQDADFNIESDSSSLSVAVMRVNSEKIEDVPLETYVARVIASEMPAEFEVEALKAQALAARTYIVNHLLHQNEDNDSDITDSTSHQVYKNEQELREQWGSEFNEKMEKLKMAVETTEGEILTYNEKPNTAAYFSTSNGFMEITKDYWVNVFL